jgi:hypothetical protein
MRNTPHHSARNVHTLPANIPAGSRTLRHHLTEKNVSTFGEATSNSRDTSTATQARYQPRTLPLPRQGRTVLAVESSTRSRLDRVAFAAEGFTTSHGSDSPINPEGKPFVLRSQRSEHHGIARATVEVMTNADGSLSARAFRHGPSGRPEKSKYPGPKKATAPRIAPRAPDF